MARSKKSEAKKLMQADASEGRSVAIKEAKIKDDFCNYTYEISGGKSVGFIHNVSGKGVIEDDLRTAFSRLNVHLAVIDDVYKHSDTQIGDIDKMHNDDLALLYTCTGFKVQGDEDNENIVLMGTKYLSSGARMELKTPKIPIDNLSSYPWHNELKTEADKCRDEVALYHYGYFTPVQEEEPQEDPAQSKIEFGKADKKGAEVVDFETGRV